MMRLNREQLARDVCEAWGVQWADVGSLVDSNHALVSEQVLPGLDAA